MSTIGRTKRRSKQEIHTMPFKPNAEPPLTSKDVVTEFGVMRHSGSGFGKTELGEPKETDSDIIDSTQDLDNPTP